ncbi:MAG: hypothetical protein AAFR61_04900 [Bacteroidota bacterium]
MFRLITNIPPAFHLFLLVLIPLLRWVCFYPGFFLEEEALFLSLAEQLAEGGTLYKDVWYSGAPLMIWIYKLFVLIFGNGALTAIRVFTCLYIYIAALYFNSILTEVKAFRRYAGVTAVMFVLLVSIPWYGLQLSASLMALVPVIISFSSLIGLSENRSNNYKLMFRAGLWIMIAILISYKAVFLWVGILLAYIIFRAFQWDEVVSMLGGMLTVLLILVLSMYAVGSSEAFWDQGVLYYLDRISMTQSALYPRQLSFALQAWGFSWGVFLLLGMLGFIHFRLRFYSYVAQVRRTEMTTAIWLIGVMLVFLFKFRRLELSDFVLMVPPLVFYVSKTFDFKIVYRLRRLVWLFAMAVPVYLYLVFWTMVGGLDLRFFQPQPDQLLLHGGTYSTLGPKDALHQWWEQYFDDQESLWIMGYDPILYQTLGVKPATPFLDFRMAYHKLACFPGDEEQKIWSKVEGDGPLYERFVEKLPRMLLDTGDYFSYLQARFPGIFSQYRGEKIGEVRVYMAPDIWRTYQRKRR